MKSLMVPTVVLVACALASSAQAGPPAELSHGGLHGGRIIVSTSVPCEDCETVVAAPPRKFRGLFRRWVSPPGPAFTVDNNRYEPRIRDIRDIPINSTMPRTLPGSIETLPLLPAMDGDYFVVPMTR